MKRGEVLLGSLTPKNHRLFMHKLGKPDIFRLLEQQTEYFNDRLANVAYTLCRSTIRVLRRPVLEHILILV